jgi:RNA ligase
MNPFPQINHIDEVREAIRDRDEFKIMWKEQGFYVINYMVRYSDTFPVPDTKDTDLNRLYMIRRECRGIKFDADGKLIARPFHKFFNIGERPETDPKQIDWSKPFVILEKLDGSMIHPIMLDGKVTYCTKHGPTDVAQPVQEFADRGIARQDGRKVRIWYNDFCYDLMQSGYTPIFEWCSRKQRIVVDYPEDKLVLTAVRKNATGEYLNMSNMHALADPYSVPVVREFEGSFDGINDFIESVHGRTDEEGYIIRFRDGTMYKIKNPWYLQLHKTAELMQNEKDVWAVILKDQVDDAKAFMSDEDGQRLEAFQRDLLGALDRVADDVHWAVVAAKDNLNESKKRFALEEVPKHPDAFKPMLFKVWDGHDAKAVVYSYALNSTGTGSKLEQLRKLVGDLNWYDY